MPTNHDRHDLYWMSCCVRRTFFAIRNKMQSNQMVDSSVLFRGIYSNKIKSEWRTEHYGAATAYSKRDVTSVPIEQVYIRMYGKLTTSLPICIYYIHFISSSFFLFCFHDEGEEKARI